MTPAPQQEEALFRAAVQLIRGPARQAFLEQACAGDPMLRQRVDARIAAQEKQRASLGPEGTDQASTVVMSSAPEEGPGAVIGRYKLLEKIGEGGFGAVYAAEQKEPVKRRVALKLIKLGMDTRQVVARFEAERQALALMDHPNIAKVLDAGATEIGRPYFVMELVKGIPITQYCDQENLSARGRLELFTQVCHAIQHAHQKGIIHRDIKPSNILVTLHDGVAVPKVIDFGIAKATQQELTEKTVYTQLQQFIGTPAYMSPEQAEMSGLDIDTRSDIYSLGVLLYELLTGSTPFDTKELLRVGLDEMRRIIREREPVRPSTRLTQELAVAAKKSGGATRDGHGPVISRLRHGQMEELSVLLRGDLDWIVMKCLEKDRSRRYETANGVAMDIKRHLNHELVVARPPSLGYRLQNSFRRNRLLFSAAGLVASALVLGALVSTWQAVRATRAGRQEAQAHVRADQAAQAAKHQTQRAEEEAQKAKASALEARQQAYAADMNLAQHALAINNIGRAGELLNRHRPQPGEADLRGWEWRYLWQQCRSDALLSVCQQSNSIWSLAVSSDSRWLAVGEAGSGGVSIWDLATRNKVAALAAGDNDARVAFSAHEPLLAFSVRKLASPTRQYTVSFWNGASRKIEGELELCGECMGLAFSEDGQTLVSYAGDPANQVALWRVPARTKLASYSVPPVDSVSTTAGTPFALARQGDVAAVAPDNTIRLIDLRTGKERWAKRATDEWVKALALSPDGQVLASGAGFTDSTVRLWEAATGKEITRLEGHRAWVTALVFLPDGKTLASASGDQTIQLWDLNDLAHVPPSRVLRGHQLEIWRLALLADGRTLATGGKDGSVYLWDTTSIQHENAHAVLPVTVAAWRIGPDSASVLTVDDQAHVALWKGSDFRQRESIMDLATQLAPCGWAIRYPVAISHDARFVATGSTNGLIQVWDLQQRTLLRQFPVGTGLVTPVEFLAQGKSLVTFHVNDKSIHEWDVTTGLEVGSWPQGTPDAAYLAFSADGRWSLAMDYDGKSVLRDMTTQHDSTQTLALRGVNDVTFSPDGRCFAAVTHLGYAKVWDRATLRELVGFRGFLMGIHSIAYSPGGKRIAAGGDGKEAVKLWDTQSWQELLTLQAQGSLFRPLAFSTDGNIIGCCNVQGALHLWRAPSWQEVQTAERNEGKEP